ncbi:hypothetical protein NC651_008822 [Populus alba x Populus x berolinensis]|nr:hypothetical protein NC651_008822 [Populus alba x Populus x berolinensis]
MLFCKRILFSSYCQVRIQCNCKLGNQKQQDTLQSTLQLLGVNMKQQQQRQMRDYLQSLALPRVQSMLSFNANVCSRRLMQYMYHQRQRPPVSDYVIKNVIISNVL